MNVQEVIEKAQDAITVRRVFGDPYEKNGVTVIPAANVSGGGGGGGDESAGGTGFGINARPSGAFVIKGESVKWEPAIDINRAMIVAIVALLTIRSVFRPRRRKH